MYLESLPNKTSIIFVENALSGILYKGQKSVPISLIFWTLVKLRFLWTQWSSNENTLRWVYPLAPFLHSNDIVLLELYVTGGTLRLPASVCRDEDLRLPKRKLRYSFNLSCWEQSVMLGSGNREVLIVGWFFIWLVHFIPVTLVTKILVLRANT